MRNILLVLSIVLLLSGCGQKYYSVSITNDSSKIVSYTYSGYSETLDVSSSKIYEVEAYTQAPRNIVDQNGIASIKLNTNGMTGNYNFINAESYYLIVTNEFPFEVTISSGNFIDNDGSMYLSINTGITNTDAKIYTKNPQFVSTLSYPVVFDRSISGDTMNVVIK